MACERIKKLLGNNTGSSKDEDDKPTSTTQRPQTSTSASSTADSSEVTSSTRSSSASTSLNDFQKKVLSNYESRANKNCSFRSLAELNPNIEKLGEDILYHIALGNKSHDLQKMFKDVKFVVMGGTPRRMEQFAYYIMNEIGYELPPGTLLNDISKHSHRYAMYKVGPVMSVSHGMGMPSIGILLHELIKLVHHAGMVDPIFVRIGTCGGFSRKGGTVVVSDEIVNDYLESIYDLSILGTNVQFPAVLDQNLASELLALADPQDNFETIKGKTYCTDSFYDGSGRADGAICEFSQAEGMEYYKKLQNNGIVNVEMESLAFAALTCRAGIKSAVLTVILSDRLETDQIKQPTEVLDEWKTRPQILLARYIKKVLAASGTSFGKVATQGVGVSHGSQKPTVTVSTPGVTPTGRVVCPPLTCGRKASDAVRTTSQPLAAASSQPNKISSSCKPLCEKRPIPGLSTGTTEAPTKPTSATDSVKSTMASAKADSQARWESCYKACGIGSEQVDPGTPHVSQQPITTKPTIAAPLKTSSATSRSFDCACDRGKIAEPGQTPMVKPTTSSKIKSYSNFPTPGSSVARTTSDSTTPAPSYKAKDFDSSSKLSDPNESRNAYYKHCVKLPKCDQSFASQKRPSGTFETPVQEKVKGTSSTPATETRPCCIRRSENVINPRSQVAEQQKYIEDQSKTPGGTKYRSSVPQPVSSLGLGPCCTGKVEYKTPKDVGRLELGPCCTGQNGNENSPNCSGADSVSPSSENLERRSSDKSDEFPPCRNETSASSQDKGREIPTDCPLVLGKKCDPNAYKDPNVPGAVRQADPSPETPDPRHGTKGPIFSTTPVPAFVTPTTAKHSCCVKSAGKDDGAVLSSTSRQSSGGSCCHQFSSTTGTAAGSSKSVTSTNFQTRNAAATSKSGTETYKYDPGASPCAACKKYQGSKIIFTSGTPSASQPEIIKCPHKLKRLKEECQGYD